MSAIRSSLAATRAFAAVRSTQTTSSFASAHARVSSRAFGVSRAALAGKESQLHNESRPEEAEKLKQEQLKDGKWKEGLASDSESIVKADKGELNGGETVEQLQKETAKLAEKEKK